MWFNLICLISGDIVLLRDIYVSLCFMVMDIECEFWIDCEKKKKKKVSVAAASSEGFVIIPMTAAVMLQNKLLNSFLKGKYAKR